MAVWYWMNLPPPPLTYPNLVGCNHGHGTAVYTRRAGGGLRPHRRDRSRSGTASQAPRVRGMREDRILVGSPANVPVVRRHPVLRQLAEPARVEARALLESSRG